MNKCRTEMGGACHFLPESSLTLRCHGKGKHSGILGIYPSAITNDVAAEHHVSTAFGFAKTFSHNHPFVAMASLTTGRCVALLQQISPKLTGQRALSFYIGDRHGRQERLPLKGAMNSKFSHRKDRQYIC